MVSALTILGLDEMTGARYGSYVHLADQIRARFRDPIPTLAEMFRRVVFNVCVSNSDDHARNHSAFWDGEWLTLTPAYDIAPGLRSGDTSAQAMARRQRSPPLMPGFAGGGGGSSPRRGNGSGGGPLLNVPGCGPSRGRDQAL